MKVQMMIACVLGLAVAGCNCNKAKEDNKEELTAKDEAVEFAATPAKVQAAFLKTYPGATVRKAEKEVYSNGTVHYEIEFTSADGKKQEVEIDSDGEVLPEH